MERKQANKIVKDTFENPFNKEQFVYFIKNLLNHIEETPGTLYRGNYIPDAYAPYVNTLERLGKYLDADERSIDVLIVNLKKNTSLERARTMQRNFIAWYLNGSRGGVLKDAALVAFVSPAQEDWRFSLVKMEYSLDTSGEKVKTKKELTPARRFSFLVGKNENTHTAQSYLSPIIADESKDLNLSNIENAFSIEKVTKEFFEKYRDLFLKLTDSLNEIVKKDQKVRADFKNRGVETVNFTKKLLGQVVFLYFLQKKGWFGVGRDEEWGTGPKNFLRLLFEKKIVDYNNFFNDILEPLFYEALATEREDSFYSRFNCKIPFLNGGLFDPINNYDWVHTDIVLLNDIFSNKHKTKEGDEGSGILDVFDRYNFTVKEDEPLEKEVAVDPEMLGKVFENLLEVKDRKSKGTYYTPREIVHYMCQQSLCNYLAEELKEKITKEEIDTLIKYGESAIEHDSRVETYGKETKTYSFKLSENIRKNASLIDEKLSDIRVCDPAVGSGAFLVGMMNEIVRVRNALTTYLRDKKQRTFYDFKRNAIHYSLYGVDMDPGATEIAKLRLWLSLVVDEEDIKQIKPLPNLDYKIMQGNSLIEDLVINNIVIKFNLDDVVKVDRRTKKTKELFKKEVQHTLFKDKSEDIFEELKKLHSVYFEENNKNKRLILKEKIVSTEQLFITAKCEEEIERLNVFKNNCRDRKRISNVESQIKTIHSTLRKLKKEGTKPFFLWKLNFSEVFIDKGGFDVIVGNPPYVQLQKTGGELANVYEQCDYVTFSRTGDIYTLFYEKAHRLLRTHGIACLITSNKWMRAGYGKLIRRYFIDVVSLLILIDFGDAPLFKNATTYTNILLFKNIPPSDCRCSVYDLSKEKGVEGRLLYYLRNLQGKYISNFTEVSYLIVNKYEFQIKQKVEAKGIPLKNWDIDIYRGILTGFNEAFIINTEIKERLCREDPNCLKIIKPILRGRDVKRYKAEFAGLWLINTHNGYDNEPPVDINDYPVIKDYLKEIERKRVAGEYGEKAKKAKGLFKRDDQGITPYNLRNCAYIPSLELGKIIWAEIVFDSAFYYDEDNYYPEATCFVMIGNRLKYLQALLNSKLLTFAFRKYYAGGDLRGNTFRYKKVFVEKLPVLRISEREQQSFGKIVDKIVGDKKKGKDTLILEEEIDELVFDLYALTAEEREQVRNSY